jgi:N-acyl-D-aspartate/D-glutamate deacylase
MAFSLGLSMIVSFACAPASKPPTGFTYGDLVLFDPDRVIDRSTTTEPHAVSLGIDKVWVNGQVVFDGRRATGLRPGMPIRRGLPQP